MNSDENLKQLSGRDFVELLRSNLISFSDTIKDPARERTLQDWLTKWSDWCSADYECGE